MKETYERKSRTTPRKQTNILFFFRLQNTKVTFWPHKIVRLRHKIIQKDFVEFPYKTTRNP
jgi:hypothetical protein